MNILSTLALMGSMFDNSMPSDYIYTPTQKSRNPNRTKSENAKRKKMRKVAAKSRRQNK